MTNNPIATTRAANILGILNIMASPSHYTPPDCEAVDALASLAVWIGAHTPLAGEFNFIHYDDAAHGKVPLVPAQKGMVQLDSHTLSLCLIKRSILLEEVFSFKLDHDRRAARPW